MRCGFCLQPTRIFSKVCLPLSAKGCVDVTQVFRAYLSCLGLQALGFLGRFFFICTYICHSLTFKLFETHAFRVLLCHICQVRARCGIDWNHPITCGCFEGTCQSSTAAGVFLESCCSQMILNTNDLRLAQLLWACT